MRKLLMIGCIGIAGVLVLLIVVVIGGALLASRGSGPQTVTQPASASPAAGVQAKPSGTAERPLARVGQRVESAGIALTVNEVRRANSLSQVQQAKPDRTFLVTDVTLENSARDKAPYNPAYFKVKDGAGYEYSASLSGPDNYLKSGELTSGENVRGIVAFDIPSTAAGLTLSYQPLVIFGGYQVLRVSLD